MQSAKQQLKTSIKTKQTLVFFLILTALATILGRLSLAPTPQDFQTAFPTHPLVLYDEKTFLEAVGKTREESEQINYSIKGAVVPHHGLVSSMIARSFKDLSREKPETIIILGPNHTDGGSFNILTSNYGWETPFGTVLPNVAINKLVNDGLVHLEPDVVGPDQAVAALVPFIKYYLPDATLVPLLFSSHVDKKMVETIGETLAKYSNNSVIIASIDFSHYLPSDEALAKDEITIQAVREGNIDKILTFNSDYLDSPGALTTLLVAMKYKQAKLEVLEHENSGILTRSPNSETTSYFRMIFH